MRENDWGKRGRAMLSKTLIQFSIDGWGCVPSLLFDLRPNYGEVMKIWQPPSKGPMHALLHSVPLTLQQATANPCLCWRLLATPGKVWVSLLWGHCSFFLGLFVPSKSLFPQSCVSSSASMVGLMATPFKRAYAISWSAAPRAPAPVAGHCWPGPPQETLMHSSGSVSVGSGLWCAQNKPVKA